MLESNMTSKQLLSTPIFTSSFVCHQLKHIGEFLKSTLLTNLANQIAHSTKQIENEFEFCRANLERLHDTLLQQEGEKDRMQKLTKKRK